TGAFNYSPVSGLQTNRSDYVAGVYVSPFTGLSLISQARFDERNWSLRRQDTAVQTNYGPLTGSVAYTYSAFNPVTGLVDTQQESMTSLALQLTTHSPVCGCVGYH